MNNDSTALMTDLINGQLKELSGFYEKLHPEENFNTFVKDLFTKIKADRQLNFKHFFTQFTANQDRLTRQKVDLIFSMSIACSAEAFERLSARDPLEASIHLGEARFWSGVIFSMLTFEGMIDLYIKKVQITVAGGGGSSRANKSWSSTKSHAQKLAKSECPANEKWPDIATAVKVIKTAVLDFHNQFKKSFSADPETKDQSPIMPINNPDRTIRLWLAEMADGDTYFHKWKPRVKVKSQSRSKKSFEGIF